MGDILRLTEDWVTITGSAQQRLEAALDVSAYDTLDFMLYTGIDRTGVGTPDFQLTLLTGMSLLSTSTWVAVPVSIPAITTDRIDTFLAIDQITGGFHRYLRWQVVLNGYISTARFLIEGVGRTH